MSAQAQARIPYNANQRWPREFIRNVADHILFLESRYDEAARLLSAALERIQSMRNAKDADLVLQIKDCIAKGRE